MEFLMVQRFMKLQRKYAWVLFYTFEKRMLFLSQHNLYIISNYFSDDLQQFLNKQPKNNNSSLFVPKK